MLSGEIFSETYSVESIVFGQLLLDSFSLLLGTGLAKAVIEYLAASTQTLNNIIPVHVVSIASSL